MTDQANRTALHYAAVEVADPTRVEDLLTQGADPNAVDSQGFTPLHFAAQSFAPHIVELLIAHGVDVDQANDVGNTALGLAVFYSNGRGEVIEKLLAAGADPDKQNCAGVSPRVLAERIANYDLEAFFENI